MSRFAAALRRFVAACAFLAPCAAHADGDVRCLEAPPPLSAAEEAAALRDGRDRGMLWRATRDGRTSWLYGTLHLGRPLWAVPGPTVRDALRRSDALALELDPADPAVTAALQRAMAKNSRLSLTAPLNRRLRAQLRKACLPEGLADQMAPEMLGATLTLMAARADGFDAQYGIDLSLARAAKAAGKPVLSLETAEAQLAGLVSGDDAALRENMDKMLTDLERGQVLPMVRRLASAWESGRDDELGDHARWCGCADTPSERARLRVLLEGRNPGLADAIDRLHTAGQSVFAAVGGLHLVGAEGLPALMARRGYTVTREPLPR